MLNAEVGHGQPHYALSHSQAFKCFAMLALSM